jgi:hypothetical protein
MRRRRSRAGGKPLKPRRYKAATRKPRDGDKAAWRRAPSGASLEAKIARLTGELNEAQERQAGTAEVLKVIGGAAGNLKPVFEAILKNATRICEATFGSMLLREGNVCRRVALHNAPPRFAEFSKKAPVLSAG